MLILNFGVWLVPLWALFCNAAPQSLSKDVQRRQEIAVSDLPCLNIMSAAAQGVYIFAASDVFDCIGKVPFHAEVASRFIDYYNDTLQFQSTLAFLRSPPEGYQQPSVDVEQELQSIRANISSGAYKTQYDFEAQVRLLISRMHDSHVTLDAGILSAFRFASPYTLLSLSQDGLEEPKLYLNEDLLAAAREGYESSPIMKINNVDAADYLTSLVSPNSDGYLEPHADWNSLLSSPATDIQGYLSLFQRLPLYPGGNLSFTFENDTTLDTIWLAIYAKNELTGPLTTPGDFFNYFGLGLIPDGFDADNPTDWWPDDYNIPFEDDNEQAAPASEPVPDCSSPAGLVVNWCNATGGQVVAYPNDPIVVQDDLSITGAGIITGYILDDISTGVLSIPSFYQDGFGVLNFFNAIEWFIGNATESNTKRVVIDLQQNSGGLVLLALTTFQQFFPALPPYTGSRIRSQYFADVLGTAYTEWWRSLDHDSIEYNDNAGSEWIAVNRINAATGRNFTSWTEYSGPIIDRDDKFSQKQLYNLSDETFDYDIFGWAYQPWVNKSFETIDASWTPNEIVLLTDGLCSSACTIFVELMTEIAGVRTVTIGGRPQDGPMQTASGSRGAVGYLSNYLDYDIDNLKTLVGNETAYESFPQRNDTGMFTYYASFNIRDQMRPDDLTPLQFRYEASDCRLYYTPGNIYNMSQLWRNAAIATWDNPGRCVPDSTGYSRRTNQSPKPAPKFVLNNSNHIDLFPGQADAALEVSFNTSIGLTAAKNPPDFVTYQKCADNDACSAGTVCEPVKTSCDGQTLKGPEVKLCLEGCTTLQSSDCRPRTKLLAQSTAQQPGGPVKSSVKLPKTFFNSQKTSPVASGQSIYNGFYQPGLQKTSKYVIAPECVA